jgi:hypothetical protein
MLEPQRPPARMLAAQLAHCLDLGRGLMGTGPGAMGAVLQPGQPFSSIAAQPPMDRLATHPVAVGHLGDRHPTQDLLDGAVALLDHAQLPQHPWPPWPRQQSRQHRKTQPRCQASAETDLSSITRASTCAGEVRCEEFLYELKAVLGRWRMGPWPGHDPEPAASVTTRIIVGPPDPIRPHRRCRTATASGTGSAIGRIDDGGRMVDNPQLEDRNDRCLLGG